MRRVSRILIALLFLAGLLLAQEKFPSTCPSGQTARFPGAATAIDSLCPPQGKPDPQQPGDAAQNEGKNNFCTDPGTPTTTTLTEIASLQKSAAAQEQKLGFKPGEPPKDRAFLKTLGEGNLVQFEGYVFEARQECGESVNCEADVPNNNADHDIHIALIANPRKTKSTDPEAKQNKEECTGFVAEMIPHHRPAEWTACNVEDIAKKGLKVRVTGQRLFDGSHEPCKNGAPVGDNPKRVSLWEIHPIYSFDVCPSGDCSSGGWQPLEQYAAGKTTCAEADCKK